MCLEFFAMSPKARELGHSLNDYSKKTGSHMAPQSEATEALFHLNRVRPL
jgi:hypothetical protein